MSMGEFEKYGQTWYKRVEETVKGKGNQMDCNYIIGSFLNKIREAQENLFAAWLKDVKCSGGHCGYFIKCFDKWFGGE